MSVFHCFYKLYLLILLHDFNITLRNFVILLRKYKYFFVQNVTQSHGSPIPLPKMISNSLGNVINDIIFGFKYPLEDQTWTWFRQIQEEGCHEMGVAGVVNFLPFVR